MNTVEQLRKIFKQSHTIAVVGLSAEWHRPSFFAAKYMQEHGYRVIPVNPRYAASATPILGERCYASLLDIPEAVDIVDVFRRTEEVVPIAQQALQIGAKCLWQQIGVVNLEADQLVREKGIESVMDRCVKIEYARLFGGLNLAGVDTKIISAKRQL
jgi:predicted CoA-binding protein